MSGLFMRRKASAERGAVATIVAVFFGGLVVAGMLALTVDVGNIMWERRQLQNGADAGALALAVTCANSAPKCDPNTTPTGLGADSIAPLISKNASDGVSGLQVSTATTVNGQCGRATGNAAMPTCASASSNASLSDLGRCPALPAWLSANPAIPYVETYTISKQASGSTVLPGYLSRMLTGAAGGTTVTACSRAAWGPAGPGHDIVLPVVISECDWKSQTGYNGTPGSAVYPAGPTGAYPGYDTTTRPWPAVEKKVYSKGNPTTCDTSAPGGTAPGGFAALDAVGAVACEATITTVSGYKWAHGDTGNDTPCPAVDLLPYLGKVVHIPVFDCLTSAPVTVISTTDCNSGNGNNTYYRISGFAAFYLSGWYFSNSTQASLRPPNAVPCANGDRCMSGWFLKDVVSDAPITSPPAGGTPNYGLTAIKPAG